MTYKMRDDISNHTYLVTSYHGLYAFSNHKSTLLRAGLYFGLACNQFNTWYVFHFPYGCTDVMIESQHDRYKKPFDRGVIASFKFVENEIFDWKIEFEGVDNGTHVIVVYKEKLYCIETFQQRVLVLNIGEDSSLTYGNRYYFKDITIDEPIYVREYLLNESFGGFLENQKENENYCHMNAITIQDDLIYINCPLGLCKNTIRVYDINFEYLWSIEIPKHFFFCHDLVFVGCKIYMTTIPDQVISYDIVRKKFNVELQLPSSSRPKGLSILQNGIMMVGLRYHLRGPHNGKIFIQNSDNSCEIQGTYKCNFITCTNKEIDYNHVNSILRAPLVKRLPSLPVYMAPVCESISRCQHVAHEYMKAHPSMQENTNDEFQEYIWNFSDFSNFDKVIARSTFIKSFVLTKKNSLHDLVDNIHYPLLNSIEHMYKNLVKNLEKKGHMTGFYYVYGPKTFLPWHTNLNYPDHQNQLRIYHVFTKYNNVSWFLYRHPISHQIHAVPDIDSYTNVFSLGTYEMPLWHAVINPSEENYRISLGFSLHPFRIEDVF